MSGSPAERAGVAAARLARQELGWGLEAPLTDILRLVEGPGTVPVTIGEVSERLSGALLLDRDNDPFIFVNGRHHPVRQRFTLAHEFGHHRLGHGEVVDGPESLTSNANNPQEVQANYFASEFLAPLQAVQAWMEAHGQIDVDLELVVRLSIDFGMSAQTARIRLEAARYMPSARAIRELDEQIRAGEHRDLIYRLGLSELRDSIAEAALLRLPAQLRTNAITAYEAGVLDVDRLARLLREEPKETATALAEHGVAQPPADEEPDW